MSPSESELRSFLHGGEGDPINPDAVIAHARAVRHDRRVRLLSVAAAIVAVGAVGTGAVVLGAGNSSTSSAGKNAMTSPAVTSPRGDIPMPLRSHADSRSAGPTCPTIPLRLMLPGGGGTGQFGGDGPLFDGPVSSMQLCGYAAAPASGQVAFSSTTVLVGAPANEIATSLNAASTMRVIRPCPIRQTRELVVYATSAKGVSMIPVVVDYSSCEPFATNGTAARYDWTPPKDVEATLTTLMTPKQTLPSLSSTSPRVSGSPVR